MMVTFGNAAALSVLRHVSDVLTQLECATLFVQSRIDFGARQPQIFAGRRHLQRCSERILEAAERKQIVRFILAGLIG